MHITSGRYEALKLRDLIQEINDTQKLESHIYSEVSKEISTKGSKAVDYSDVYHSNQQVFYSSLRCWYELDAVVSQEACWSPMELGYFYRLQLYLRKLLNASKLLPSLTYLFWQHSLGRCSEQDLRHQLSNLCPLYAEAHSQAVNALGEIKYYK